MSKALGTITGKTARQALRFRRGGGQALPGLIVEKAFPNYVGKMLGQLPEGVVIITGTNGKTTTTKIVVELLESQGKKVLTNSTGSNLIRGIASSISQSASLSGKLKKDIAVLELDEATARRLVEQVKPRWVMGLNVSRDQLDRFGEVDTVASYIGTAMEQASQGLITNARDPYLSKIAERIASSKRLELGLFGASVSLSQFFPTDYELAAVNRGVKSREKPAGLAVELLDFNAQEVKYRIAGRTYKLKLKLTGQHNFLNAAAALALVTKLMPDVSIDDWLEKLSKVELAFGRGEIYKLKNGSTIELVLVKNPASFTQALASYGSSNEDLMIAINDNIADGRDVSWLWDVNFAPLHNRDVQLTAGTRAPDMALRLGYDDIKVNQVEPNLRLAVKKLSARPGRKVILSTYTAMLQLYKLLSKQGQKI